MPVAVSYKVLLTYFKQSGKFYSEAEYTSLLEDLHDIWAEVRQFQESGKLPGLMPDCGREFIIHVSVPGHPHDHPKLIV